MARQFTKEIDKNTSQIWVSSANKITEISFVVLEAIWGRVCCTWDLARSPLASCEIGQGMDDFLDYGYDEALTHT